MFTRGYEILTQGRYPENLQIHSLSLISDFSFRLRARLGSCGGHKVARPVDEELGGEHGSLGHGHGSQ